MPLDQLIERNKQFKTQEKEIKRARNIYHKDVIKYFTENIDEYIKDTTVSIEGDSYRGTDYYPYKIGRVTFNFSNKQTCQKIIDFSKKIGIDWLTFNYKEYTVSIHSSNYQGETVNLFFDNEKTESDERYPKGMMEKNNIAFLNSVYEFLKEHNIAIIRPDEKKFKKRLEEEVNKALLILDKTVKKEQKIEKKQSKITELFNKYLFRE